MHLAFGHDEEVGGDEGAAKISQLLESRGVRVDILLDEGGLIAVDGMSPLTNAKIALVGTAEKVVAGACMLSGQLHVPGCRRLAVTHSCLQSAGGDSCGSRCRDLHAACVLAGVHLDRKGPHSRMPTWHG